LGRLTAKKGIDIVIETFANVARDHDDIFLIIAGPDDGVRSNAEALIKRHGVEQRSLFTGMVSGEDKRLILGGSDLFLLPSKSENFGITVVEAAACRIPLVISDRVNLCREFEEAGAALTAPPVVERFSAHVRFLLENPEMSQQIAQRAARLVRSRFGWDALGGRYEEMYSVAARSNELPELR